MQGVNELPTVIHFIDVGQGNMTLLQLDNSKVMLYDCNVTNNNENKVLNYLGTVLGWDTPIDIFVNSHRDADHMRGIKKVHHYFPIQKIWDSGVTGNTTNSAEYLDYMDLRRRVGFREVERRKRWSFGKTVLRVMNSKNGDIEDDPNAQSIVIKAQHTNKQASNLSSVLLCGDTDAQTWRYSILNFYEEKDLNTEILLASHHGSNSFFDDPNDDEYYYTDHLEMIKPAMTIISVGKNTHGHPDKKALEFYESYSRGSQKGNKIKRTDQHGTIKLMLKDEGGWTLTTKQ